MTTQYDEKGKVFTNVITKVPFHATIQTITHKVCGEIHVRLGERLKDGLNQAEDFIAVTNATVFGPNDEIIYQTKFLTVNIAHIVWLLPDEDLNEN